MIGTITGLKWGKLGPSYLLSKNGELSFLLFFSKQCLVENFQGTFRESLKKFIGKFNFGGITLRKGLNSTFSPSTLTLIAASSGVS